MITPLTSGPLVRERAADLLFQTTALAEAGVEPSLAIVQGVGHSSLSGEVAAYVSGKQEDAARLGISTGHLLVSPARLGGLVARLNDDPRVTGIIVEYPIPGFDRGQASALFDTLNPAKAVDNQGSDARWGMGATPQAVVNLLDFHGRTGEDEHVLVVGGNGNVGRPLVEVYGQRKVRDLSVVDTANEHEFSVLARAANIVILATGQQSKFTPDEARSGQAIISVGAHEVHPAVRQITDRDFLLTPKKGGVGPLTRINLLGRVVDLAAGREPQHPFLSPEPVGSAK